MPMEKRHALALVPNPLKKKAAVVVISLCSFLSIFCVNKGEGGGGGSIKSKPQTINKHYFSSNCNCVLSFIFQRGMLSPHVKYL